MSSPPAWTWADITKLRQLRAAAGSPEELKRWIDSLSRVDSKFTKIDHELLGIANFLSANSPSVKAAISAVVESAGS